MEATVELGSSEFAEVLVGEGQANEVGLRALWMERISETALASS